jgi:ankyrin repeat protein
MEIRMPDLFDAAKKGNLSDLVTLKVRGANLNQRDENGNTALLWASCFGHLHIIKYLLLENDSKITDKNDAGNTALLLAVAYNHLSVVQWLLEEGEAQISEQNNYESSPLLMALKQSGYEATQNYFIKNCNEVINKF